MTDLYAAFDSFQHTVIRSTPWCTSRSESTAYLMSTTDTNRDRAKAAFEVLCCLTSTSRLFAEQVKRNQELLAQLDFCCLCNLLCPKIDEGEENDFGHGELQDLDVVVSQLVQGKQAGKMSQVSRTVATKLNMHTNIDSTHVPYICHRSL